ncbi:MAG: antitoxin Xre/MbcA/ParS toxin-binding domain-containing protein [Opitutales bacterium]
MKRFCKRYHLIRPDLTRLTGYSLRSVDKWAGGEIPGGPARKQLTELTRLFDALCEIMDPESIGQWLKTPNQAFEGSTPIQVIERGETDRIWRMIHLIESGEPL